MIFRKAVRSLIASVSLILPFSTNHAVKEFAVSLFVFSHPVLDLNFRHGAEGVDFELTPVDKFLPKFIDSHFNQSGI